MNSCETSTVMLLSQREERRLPIRALFADAGWMVHEGASLADLQDLVALGWRGVVISDLTLPDPSWRGLLSCARSGCELIVISPLADDRMWSDLLDAGAFDLVVYPFERSELLRVVSAAWRQIADRNAQRFPNRPISTDRRLSGARP